MFKLSVLERFFIARSLIFEITNRSLKLNLSGEFCKRFLKRKQTYIILKELHSKAQSRITKWATFRVVP